MIKRDSERFFHTKTLSDVINKIVCKRNIVFMQLFKNWDIIVSGNSNISVRHYATQTKTLYVSVKNRGMLLETQYRITSLKNSCNKLLQNSAVEHIRVIYEHIDE